jgi:hypothetical protein
MYGIDISFPKLPTKEDVKKLRKEVAKDRFAVLEGEPPKAKPKDGQAKRDRKK